MAFQFLCPQGHLLQGEEAHMGMQCQCPQCGTAFIIPTLPGAAPQDGEEQAESLELVPLDDDARQTQVVENVPVEIEIDLDPESVGLEALESQARDPLGRTGSELDIGELLDESGEALLHIPCPNGHMLDVSYDMLGNRARCPHCRVEFRLQREKSIEYLREQEILDAKRARFWFKLALVAAGVVGVLLLVMVIAIVVS